MPPMHDLSVHLEAISVGSSCDHDTSFSSEHYCLRQLYPVNGTLAGMNAARSSSPATVRRAFLSWQPISHVAGHADPGDFPCPESRPLSNAHRRRLGRPRTVCIPARSDTLTPATGRRSPAQADRWPSRVRHVSHPVISTRPRHCPTTESLGNSGFIEALDIAFRGVEVGSQRPLNRVPEVHRHLG